MRFAKLWPVFLEKRQAQSATASTPEFWAGNFRTASIRTSLSIAVDSRWRLIRKYIPAGRVLDAGCGIGEWVSFLSKHGYEAEGLDYSDELIGKVQSAYPHIRWKSGTTQDSGYDDDSFDGVISWGVIEHDEAGPDRQLSEFRRILKRKGKAIVTVPHDCEEMRAASPHDSSGQFFQYFMSVAELTEFAKHAGFDVLEAGITRERSASLSFPALSRFRPMSVFLKYMPFVQAGMIYAVLNRP